MIPANVGGLQDTDDGGETAFPQGSVWVDPAMPQRFGPYSDCAKGHVAVKPRKGAPVQRKLPPTCIWVMSAVKGVAPLPPLMMSIR